MPSLIIIIVQIKIKKFINTRVVKNIKRSSVLLFCTHISVILQPFHVSSYTGNKSSEIRGQYSQEDVPKNQIRWAVG